MTVLIGLITVHFGLGLSSPTHGYSNSNSSADAQVAYEAMTKPHDL